MDPHNSAVRAAVYRPAPPPDADAAVDRPVNAARPLRRILCVEDEIDIQRIIEASLGGIARYEVRSCTEALRALESAREFRPDLILLDYMMPDMTGPEVMAQFRNHADLARIPVVFLTARASREQAERLRAIGSAGVLFKPFDMHELPRQLQAIWDELEGAPR